jgi:hypothetical protein
MPGKVDVPTPGIFNPTAQVKSRTGGEAAGGRGAMKEHGILPMRRPAGTVHPPPGVPTREEQSHRLATGNVDGGRPRKR